MNKKLAAFFGRHNFIINRDINPVVDALLFDMDQGLKGLPASQKMIRTFTTPPSSSASGKSVIVIDAGGTNFRSCLVSFDEKGKPSISEMEKTKMPGVERELTKKEFFDQFAENLEHLKDKSENIGFCFSYPVTILEDGDGVLINFSKEVKAPEVEGCTIGKELKAALKDHGWKKDLHVLLLNDTVSALLAGAADPDEGMVYSSYIGFILGTGMNCAYIQKESPEYPGLKTQIINCETGQFKDVLCSDFDKEMDRKSQKPGLGIMEKLCSGAYMGAVAYETLQAAAKEKIFSEPVCKKIEALDVFTTIDLNCFLHAPHSDGNLMGKLLNESGSGDDFDIMFEMIDAVASRTASMAAAILAANVIKSGEGTSASKPVCVLCNGTTFFKTYKVMDRVKGLLEEVLVNQRGLYYDLISRDNDITLGTAIGGLI